MPDEIIVMIEFSDSPWPQEQLRSFCRESTYRPLESLHIDHIGPLTPDEKDRCILSLGQIIPHKDYGCVRGYQHFGRFGTPDVIHTDQGPAFHNELFSEGRTFLRYSVLERGERYRRAR